MSETVTAVLAFLVGVALLLIAAGMLAQVGVGGGAW